MRRDAEKSIRYNLTLSAIVKAENIEASEEELNRKYSELADQYKLDETQIRDQINSEALKQEVALNKAVEFIVENLVTQPAKKKK